MKEDDDNDNSKIMRISTVQRILKSIENQIFSFFYALLEDKEEYYYFTFMSITINFIQIVGFAFRDNKQAIWQSDLFPYIKYFFEYFSVMTYIRFTSWNVYIIFCLFALFVDIFVYSTFGLFVFSLGKKSKNLTSYTSWIMEPIRWLIILFTTFLYIPMLEILLSVFACVTNNQGVQVHYVFSEVNCWETNHLIMVIINCLSLILFIVFIGISSLLYFESSITSSGCNSKKNGLLGVILLIIVFLFVIFDTLIENYIIQLFIYFAGSCLFFFKIRTNPPFLNENISIIWLICATFFLWTAIMMILSYILENTIVNGSIYVWLVMIPFLFLIQLTNDNYLLIDYDINLNRFPNSNSIVNHSIFILRLIKWDINNAKKGKLLNGYIQHHNMTCEDSTCPLKRMDFSKSYYMSKPMYFGNEKVTDKRLSLCYETVYTILSVGVMTLFPHDNDLKIHLYCYVITHMDLKEQAIGIYNFLRNSKMNFYQKFLVFRYNKILDMKIENSKNYEQITTIEEIEFEIEYKNFQYNLEKVTTFLMNFWTTLQETIVDFNRLGNLGLQIQSYYQKVEKNWKALQKVNTYSLKSYGLFAKFKNEIFDDRTTKYLVLNRMKELIDIQTKKNDFSLKSNKNAIIVIWIDHERLGKISDLNISCAQMFGYLKEDLVGKDLRVNMLMPDVFSEKHDAFLRAFHERDNVEVSNLFLKPKMVYGKHRSKYIFPVNLTIRVVPIGSLGALKIYGNFEQDVAMKNIAIIVTNLEGTIINLNSACINNFTLTVNSIQERKISINELFPGLFENKSEYQVKHGKMIIYESDDIKNGEHKYLCQCEEYKVRKKEPVCIIFRFEKIVLQANIMKITNYSSCYYSNAKLTSHSAGNSQTQGSNRKHFKNLFEFAYDFNSGKIMGGEKASEKIREEAAEMEKERLELLNSEVHLNEEKMRNSPVSFRKPGVNFQLDNALEEPKSSYRSKKEEGQVSAEDHINILQEGNEAIRYGEGIRTLILWNNRLNELKDIKNEDMEAEDSDQMENVRLEMEKKDGGIINPASAAYEKEDERTYKDKTKTLFNLLILAIFSLILVLIIIANLDYNSKTSRSDSISTLYDAVDYSHRRSAEIQNILGNIREIYLVNLGLFGSPNGTEGMMKKQNAVKRINKALDLIKFVQNLLVTKVMFDLVPVNQRLNTEDVTTVYYQDGSSIRSDLDKGVQQFYSVAFDLINNDLDLITMEHFKVYFLEFNMFNEFWATLMKSSDNIVARIRELSDFSTEEIQFTIIYCCVAFLIFLIYSFFFYFILQLIKRPKHELLNNFLKIHDYVITYYQNKCELFLLFLAAEDSGDDLNNSMEDDDDDHHLLTTSNDVMKDTHKRLKGEGEDDGIIKKKIKKAKYQKNNFSLFAILLVFIGICLTYFMVVMNLYSGMMLKLTKNLDEYNVTSLTETYFYFTDNAQRKIFLDKNFLILKENGYEYVKKDLTSMIQLNGEMMRTHVLNYAYIDSSYHSTFSDVIMSSLCQRFHSQLNSEEYQKCITILEGSPNQGLTQSLTHFIEGLIFMNNIYENYRQNPNAAYFWSGEDYVKVAATTQTNNILNILRSHLAQEIYEFNDIFKLAFIYLKEVYKKSLINNIQTTHSLILTILVVFIIFLILGFLFVYLPWVKMLRDEFSKILELIDIMPKGIVQAIMKGRSL